MKLICMNADGPNKAGASGLRRQSIQDIVYKFVPDIIFFQQFMWTSLETGKFNAEIQQDYTYIGNKEASLLYNKTNLRVEIIEDNYITELNRQKTYQFPRSHVCLRKVTIIRDDITFICISWHGLHKTSKSGKQKDFRDLMRYAKRLHTYISRPVVIAGDFNLDMEYARDNIQRPFVVYPYQPSRRRPLSEVEVVDYFIASGGIQLHDVQYIQHVTESDETELSDSGAESDQSDSPVPPKKGLYYTDVLDHDPISATLTFNGFGGPLRSDYEDMMMKMTDTEGIIWKMKKMIRKHYAETSDNELMDIMMRKVVNMTTAMTTMRNKMLYGYDTETPVLYIQQQNIFLASAKKMKMVDETAKVITEMEKMIRTRYIFSQIPVGKEWEVMWTRTMMKKMTDISGTMTEIEMMMLTDQMMRKIGI
jgi:hypothetical protein